MIDADFRGSNITAFAAPDREEQEAKMEIAHKVNVLLVCAAFVFVGALVIGVLP
ncbi:MAG: hypothetical protein MUE79_04315 [Nitratireductor sp.]|nr:hypothetical protein [Nitratireductor sp.]